jgi:hypothetical protein
MGWWCEEMNALEFLLLFLLFHSLWYAESHLYVVCTPCKQTNKQTRHFKCVSEWSACVCTSYKSIQRDPRGFSFFLLSDYAH